MAKIVHTNVGVGIETLAEWMNESIHALDEDGEIVVSAPPSGSHKIYGIYALKTGEAYHLVMVLEDTPEP